QQGLDQQIPHPLLALGLFPRIHLGSLLLSLAPPACRAPPSGAARPGCLFSFLLVSSPFSGDGNGAKKGGGPAETRNVP
ncbi:hypothetical protein, partial [Rhodovulum sulfidophilum]|uniref:hypothetical protein n=1 Tax=Rhodovulum sulfidophilum TaxID=35806 RepID=UPI001F231593